jgi:hypothetical protein
LDGAVGTVDVRNVDLVGIGFGTGIGAGTHVVVRDVVRQNVLVIVVVRVDAKSYTHGRTGVTNGFYEGRSKQD